MRSLHNSGSPKTRCAVSRIGINAYFGVSLLLLPPSRVLHVFQVLPTSASGRRGLSPIRWSFSLLLHLYRPSIFLWPDPPVASQWEASGQRPPIARSAQNPLTLHYSTSSWHLRDLAKFCSPCASLLPLARLTRCMTMQYDAGRCRRGALHLH